ncbi:hypothetical protein OsJ_14780 [Oryza sativa Japonica Group]|uniref:Uncharacterized protein n=1 Tax=Oryza sativa subsp. japonica TaxID=39947 RepID=B9FF52_ORYSJ|nr:hypothetical protein OsJ_14780 [Oryza sativa Japonica Group]
MGASLHASCFSRRRSPKTRARSSESARLPWPASLRESSYENVGGCSRKYQQEHSLQMEMELVIIGDAFLCRNGRIE